MSEKIKVVLTGRRPVLIDGKLWPCIAKASDKTFDGEFDFQATRTSECTLKVRQHANGCALVYGLYSYDSQWREEQCYDIRGGLRLSPGANLAEAIAAVAADLEGAVGDVRPEDARVFARLARECVGDLPAEDIECPASDPARLN